MAAIVKSIDPVTLHIRIAGMMRLRIRIAILIMRFAAHVAGCIKLDIEAQDDELEFTADGLPRALSLREGQKGYRRDAIDYGLNVVVRLDGVEQRDVLAYDIDAGYVMTYRRDADTRLRLSRMGEDGVEGLMVHKDKGVVTIERRVA